jgi:hypothetical protein
VLTHTDLRPTNIIVDENLQIQGIIDWEWANTVPRQLFLSPTWIAGCTPDMVSSVEFRIEYRWLRDVLRADTSEHCRQLALEWDRKLPRRIDMSLAVIFRHRSCFVNAYYRGVFPMFYESSWEREVKKFHECDGEDGKVSIDVQHRSRESERYARHLERTDAPPSQRCRGIYLGEKPGEAHILIWAMLSALLTAVCSLEVPRVHPVIRRQGRLAICRAQPATIQAPLPPPQSPRRSLGPFSGPL